MNSIDSRIAAAVDEQDQHVLTSILRTEKRTLPEQQPAFSSESVSKRITTILREDFHDNSYSRIECVGHFDRARRRPARVGADHADRDQLACSRVWGRCVPQHGSL